MPTQTDLQLFVVSQEAEDIVLLLRKAHWHPRMIPDFRGPISGPTFNLKGDMLYMPFREEDKKIIPKSAFKLHETIRKAGYSELQVIIGHEVKEAPEVPLRRPASQSAIDWGNIAEITARGLLVGMLGIVMVPLYVLSGAFLLLDPSYCLVLNDGAGTVVELLRWNEEV